MDNVRSRFALMRLSLAILPLLYLSLFGAAWHQHGVIVAAFGDDGGRYVLECSGEGHSADECPMCRWNLASVASPPEPQVVVLPILVADDDLRTVSGPLPAYAHPFLPRAPPAQSAAC